MSHLFDADFLIKRLIENNISFKFDGILPSFFLTDSASLSVKMNELYGSR